ncbi:hypothetical protein DM01DRAFT_1387263 [Hesseltinella vesiculosa]|uniref:F-box domain-containing protein n=1 Tax=Hesseltinella vesiculosa TaxID=101127 RepID=A0A1X2G2H7_9FUNG|nr:hypothetical protein DM01DRAFT_1387263 [Hesseltinella vesiculosa]
MTRIAYLPLEIAQNIGAHLPNSSLVVLCCTCKNLYQTLLPLFYRHVQLSQLYHLPMFIDTLYFNSRLRPSLNQTIRSITLTFTVDTLILDMLSCLCPQATALKVIQAKTDIPAILHPSIVKKYRDLVFPNRVPCPARPLAALFNHPHLTSLTLQWSHDPFSAGHCTVFCSLPRNLLDLSLKPGYHSVSVSVVSMLHQSCPKLQALEIHAESFDSISNRHHLVIAENHSLKRLSLCSEEPWPQPWQWFWFIGKKYAHQLCDLTMKGRNTVTNTDHADMELCYTVFAQQHAASLKSLGLFDLFTGDQFWECMRAQPACRLTHVRLDIPDFFATANSVTRPSRLQVAFQYYKATVCSFQLTLPSPPIHTYPHNGLTQVSEALRELEGCHRLTELTLTVPSLNGVHTDTGTIPVNDLLQRCSQLTRLDLQKSTLFMSPRPSNSYHPLVALHLTRCFLREGFLATAFADLPCIKSFTLDQSVVLLDKPNIFPKDPMYLNLPRAKDIALTIRSLCVDVGREHLHFSFGRITLMHTQNDPHPLTWTASQMGMVDPKGKLIVNIPQSEGPAEQRPQGVRSMSLHLQVLVSSVDSLNFEGSALVKK